MVALVACFSLDTGQPSFIVADCLNPAITETVLLTVLYGYDRRWQENVAWHIPA